MTELLIVFALVLTRLSAFFMILPVFGWTAIPVLLRVAAIVLLSVFFTTQAPMGLAMGSAMGQISLMQVLWLMTNEATYGLALGVIVYAIFSVVRSAGGMIEEVMGFTMAEIMDPLTGESSQPLSSLLEMAFILLILATNGHHVFLQAIGRSYETFPVGTIPTIQVLTHAVIQATSVMLVASLRLAAPILAAFLVLLVVLAIMARLVPEMNIFFISPPLQVTLGLTMAIAFLPLVQGFLAEFAQLMGQLLPL